MVQFGDQQQGHYQGTSKAFPHDGNNSFVSFLNSSPYDTVNLGMVNFSPHDLEMAQDSHVTGLGYKNESGDSNFFPLSLFFLFLLLPSRYSLQSMALCRRVEYVRLRLFGK